MNLTIETTIKDLRMNEALSQQNFAEKYNIPVRTLQEWEQGRSTPPAYVISLIERVQTLSAPAFERIPTPARDTWKVCIPQPFQNCEHIYPIQQKKVAQLLQGIKEDPNVEKVIIFGSSTTMLCHIGSDVDIYIEMKENKNPLANREAFPFAFDLFTNFSVDERLYKEISKKGVVVHER